MSPERRAPGRRSALSLLGAAIVLACSRTDGPREPVWGKEPCAHCRMLVGDRRYAAQVLHEGERRFFDDVGCMVLWLEERGAPSDPAWVRDANGPGWLDARSARYVGGKATPMDFGFEARQAQGIGFEEMRGAVTAKKGLAR